jgi:hypothetical protein
MILFAQRPRHAAAQAQRRGLIIQRGYTVLPKRLNYFSYALGLPTDVLRDHLNVFITICGVDHQIILSHEPVPLRGQGLPEQSARRHRGDIETCAVQETTLTSAQRKQAP